MGVGGWKEVVGGLNMRGGRGHERRTWTWAEEGGCAGWRGDPSPSLPALLSHGVSLLPRAVRQGVWGWEGP